MNQSRILIAEELIRELLDLPDSIEIAGGTLRKEWPDDPYTFILFVNHDDERAERDIRPVYTREYEGDVIRVRLAEISGYEGALEPRPSTKRRDPINRRATITGLRAEIAEAHARGDRKILGEKLDALCALAGDESALATAGWQDLRSAVAESTLEDS